MAKRLVRIGEQNEMDTPLIMTMTDIEDYVREWSSQGRSDTAIANYHSALESLYNSLSEKKQITRRGLEEWRRRNEERYSPSTVNSMLTACNGYLAYMGRRDLQFTRMVEREYTGSPELTREEYHRLLTAAKLKGDELTYLLVKTFALTGINVQELPQITVEAARAGHLVITSYGAKRRLRLPPVLAEDILSYAGRQGIGTGPVFTKRDRSGPLQRTTVTVLIRKLSEDARVDQEKCNPQALRGLYQTSLAEAEDRFRPLVQEMLERRLEQEQITAGWES